LSSSVWWWDSYVHPLNFYPVIGAVGKFMAQVNWTHGNWRPLSFDLPRSTDVAVTWTDQDVQAELGWGKAPTAEFTIGPTGLSGDAEVPQFLYCTGKADLRTAPAFAVHFEHPGRFLVHVIEVSASGTLHFALDGQPVSDVPLSAAPPADPTAKPDYVSTQLQPKWRAYQAKFDKEYGIDVPAGDHRVTLSNESGDWIQISGLRLTGYRSSAYPNVNLCGETNGVEAILWVQNAAHNWKNLASGAAIPPLHALHLTVHGLDAGLYRVEWWGTTKGAVSASNSASCASGVLQLDVPDTAMDLAAHLVQIPVVATAGRGDGAKR